MNLLSSVIVYILIVLMPLNAMAQSYNEYNHLNGLYVEKDYRSSDLVAHNILYQDVSADFDYIHLYYGSKVPKGGFINSISDDFVNPEFFLWKDNVRNRYRLLIKIPESEDKLTYLNKLKAYVPDAFVWVWLNKSKRAVEEKDFLPVLGSDSSSKATEPADDNVFIREAQKFAAKLDGKQSSQFNEVLEDHVKDEVNNYINDQVNEYANDFVTNSLKSIDGVVRSSLDISTEGVFGEVEAIVPLHATDNDFIFIQPGVTLNNDERFNGRDFAHVGLGYRAIVNSTMYGINSFIDYDLERGHRRGSIGGELKHESYSLYSNAYFPLSDWKTSPDTFEQLGNMVLDERPAKSIDFGIEGYLPAYPWLSADATYRQYFGENVESPNGDNPTTNPFETSVGLTYTPIPLVNLGVNYSYHSGQGDDFSAGLELKYVFGESIANQIDPSYVNVTKRTDYQMKTSFVQRNNDIVLEYRKKPFSIELIKDAVTVKAGQFINAWDYVRYVNGEQIRTKLYASTTSDVMKVAKLSPYAANRTGLNVYTASKGFKDKLGHFITPGLYELKYQAILKDDEFHQTKPLKITVIADEAKINGVYSSFIVTRDNATADGVERNQLVLSLRDDHNNPVKGETVSFSIPGSHNNVQLLTKDGVTDANGQISVELTNLVAEVVEITALHTSGERKSSVVFGAGAAANLTISATTGAKKADNTEYHTVTATLTDANGHAVKGKTLTFKHNRTGTDATSTTFALDTGWSTYTTDASGQVKVQVKTGAVGSFKVTAEHGVSTDADYVSIKEADQATVLFGAGAAANLTISATTGAKKADNTEYHTVTATLTDANGHAVKGKTLTFKHNRTGTDATSTTFALDTGWSTYTTDASGQVKVQVKTGAVGSFKVTAEHGVSTDADYVSIKEADQATVLFGAGAAANLTISATTGAKKADNTEYHTVTATLTDANGHAVKGKTLTFKHNRTGTDATSTTFALDTGWSTYTTDASGQVKVQVKTGAVGSFKVTAEHGVSTDADYVSIKEADQATVLFGAGAAANLTISATTGAKKADNTEYHTVTATLTDANGHAVKGKTLTFKHNRTGTDATSTTFALDTGWSTYTTDASGQVKVQVKTGAVGSFKVTAEHGVSTDADYVSIKEADQATVLFGAGAAANLTISATTGAKKADNTEYHTVTATLTDANGHAVKGKTLTFKHNRTGTDATSTTFALDTGWSTYTTDASGQVKVQVKTGAVGSFKVTAEHGVSTDADYVSIKEADQATVLFGAGAAANLTISATTGAKKADNTEYHTVTATLTDANGHAVKGKTLTFKHNRTGTDATSTTFALDTGWSTYTTDASGQVKVQVKTGAVGSFKVTAEHGVSTDADYVSIKEADQATVLFGAGAAANLTISATTGAKKADNTEYHTVTATLTDANGHAVKGKTLTFKHNRTGTDATSTTFALDTGWSTYTTDASGQVKVQVKTGAVGSFKVTAEHGVSTDADYVSIKEADQATVLFGAGAAANLTISATTGAKKADNTEYHTVTATLTDANGHAVKGKTLTFKHNRTGTDATSTTFALDTGWSTYTTDASGQVKVQVKTGAVGSFKVTAEHGVSTDADYVSIKEADQATVLFGAGAAANLTISATTGAKKADNTEYHTVTATLTDANGHAVKGKTLTFKHNRTGTDATSTTFALDTGWSTYTTDASGQIKVQVKTTALGSFDVTAEYGVSTDADYQSASAAVVFDAASVGNLTVSATTGTKKADNQEYHTVTATLTDTNNQPMQGKTLTFKHNRTVADAANTALTLDSGWSTYTTDASGQIKVQVKTTALGSFDVTAEYGVSTDADYQSASAAVVFDAASVGNLTVSATTGTKKADNQEYHTVTATLTDTNNQPMQGKTLTFKHNRTVADAANTALTLDSGWSTYTTDASGQIKVQVKTTALGSFDVTAEYGVSTDADYQSASAAVVFDAASVGNLTVSATTGTKKADNQEYHTVTATLTDTNNQPMQGKTLTFKHNRTVADAANTALTLDSGWSTYTTDASGQIKVQVKTTALGSFDVTAEYGVSTDADYQSASAAVVFDAASAAGISVDVTTKAIDASNRFATREANGSDTHEAKVVVTDAQGQPVQGIELAVSATNAANVELKDSNKTKTNVNGELYYLIKSSQTGESIITASVKGNSSVTDNDDMEFVSYGSNKIEFFTDTSGNVKHRLVHTKGTVGLNLGTAVGNTTHGGCWSATVSQAGCSNTSTEGYAGGQHYGGFIEANGKLTFGGSASFKNADSTAPTAWVVNQQHGEFAAFVNIVYADGRKETVRATYSKVVAGISVDVTTKVIDATNRFATREANGSDTHEAKVVVTDAQGQPVQGIELAVSATNAANVELKDSNKTKTNVNGELYYLIKSSQTGESIITASVKGNSSVTDNDDMEFVSYGSNKIEFFTDTSGNVKHRLVHTKGTVGLNLGTAVGNTTHGGCWSATVSQAGCSNTSTEGYAGGQHYGGFIEANGKLTFGGSASFKNADSTAPTAWVVNQQHGEFAAFVNIVYADGRKETVRATYSKVVAGISVDVTTKVIDATNRFATREANGSDTHEAKVVVTDAQGQPVQGIELAVSATNAANVELKDSNKTKTNVNGELYYLIKSSQTGESIITASVKGNSSVTDNDDMEFVSYGSNKIEFFTDTSGNVKHRLVHTKGTVGLNLGTAVGNTTHGGCWSATVSQAGCSNTWTEGYAGGQHYGGFIEANGKLTFGGSASFKNADSTAPTAWVVNQQHGEFAAFVNIVYADGRKETVRATYSKVVAGISVDVTTKVIDAATNRFATREANGSDTHEAKVVVTDAQGQPVQGIELAVSATNAANVELKDSNKTKTNVNGELYYLIKSSQTGESIITASVKGNSSVTDNDDMEFVSYGSNKIEFFTDTSGNVKHRLVHTKGTVGLNLGTAVGNTTHGGCWSATVSQAGCSNTWTEGYAGGQDYGGFIEDNGKLKFGGSASFKNADSTAPTAWVVNQQHGEFAAFVNIVYADGRKETVRATYSKVVAGISVDVTTKVIDATNRFATREANGSDTHEAKVVVTDAQGQPFQGIELTVSATNAANVELKDSNQTRTNAKGELYYLIKSSQTGESIITASVKGNSSVTDNDDMEFVSYGSGTVTMTEQPNGRVIYSFKHRGTTVPIDMTQSSHGGCWSNNMAINVCSSWLAQGSLDGNYFGQIDVTGFDVDATGSSLYFNESTTVNAWQHYTYGNYVGWVNIKYIDGHVVRVKATHSKAADYGTSTLTASTDDMGVTTYNLVHSGANVALDLSTNAGASSFGGCIYPTCNFTTVDHIGGLGDYFNKEVTGFDLKGSSSVVISGNSQTSYRLTHQDQKNTVTFKVVLKFVNGHSKVVSLNYNIPENIRIEVVSVKYSDAVGSRVRIGDTQELVLKVTSYGRPYANYKLTYDIWDGQFGLNEARYATQISNVQSSSVTNSEGLWTWSATATGRTGGPENTQIFTQFRPKDEHGNYVAQFVPGGGSDVPITAVRWLQSNY
ncbi:Ig-like domain-containing protein [Vibrio chagasii]|uniref:Ig-like domain-containing protein n=1 Tax=Vibrio chagasii TaxID=170679 RepID=UPI0038CDB037